MSNHSYRKKVNMKLLDEDKIIDLSELFKIFGDSTRVKIINVLLDNELCVGDIADKINVSQSAVSHQLRILKDSKLVKFRKEGNMTYYYLADDHVEKIFKMGCEHVNEA
ncbi:MAG TPA: winged helix-turn-helix transcriptional regulator [Candidatus Aphodocola excrementigallinarum]|uniref:Winged helix-turn-helix transcriptional regulator n=1 Tax=Candidatus Aphodocola excrementigallinarum TaxID=2840670 RepID=A0A9D1LI17_9FIRM|nr:winged helix-turn-helix transcriptional regulator [Candidatus Aphodocola excrementigallinarum]